MRVIGGHDYYDSAMAMGHDPSLVFQRNQDPDITPETAERAGISQRALPVLEITDLVKDRKLERHRFIHWGRVNDRVELFIARTGVIACGRQYSGMRVEIERRRVQTGREQIVDVVWTADQFRRLLRQNELSAEVARRGFALRHEERPRSLEAYFAPLELDGKSLEFLIDRRIALMTRRPGGRYSDQPSAPWEVNRDNMADFAFYKVFDPYAMFQELAMFVGGVLPRADNETVEIDDRTRKYKHGFDERSFRKPPET